MPDPVHDPDAPGIGAQAGGASVLVLPRYPHETTGTGQRSLLLLDAAARRGPVHVVLLDGAGPVETLAARDGVASVSVMESARITPKGPLARLLGPLRVVAPGLAYRPDPAFRAALASKIAGTGADRVLFRYARLYCAAGIDDAPALRVLVDVDDRDDQKYASRLRLKLGAGLARLAAARLARVLRARLERAGLVWFAAAEDAWPLARPAVQVLPNVPHAAPEVPPPLDPASPVVLFVGSHAHLPNRDGVAWFLAKVWPAVVAGMPGARCRIVGAGPWRTMAADHAGAPGVDFVGPVGDLGAEYARARVAICPVREGGGSKIKAVEAAAFARPVVGTGHTVRGFDGDLARGMVATDDPGEMAAACIAYLRDADRAAAEGARLRAAQQAQYSRAAVLARLERDITHVPVAETGVSDPAMAGGPPR